MAPITFYFHNNRPCFIPLAEKKNVTKNIFKKKAGKDWEENITLQMLKYGINLKTSLLSFGSKEIQIFYISLSSLIHFHNFEK